MYPVSRTYLQALTGSATHRASASAWYGGKMVAELELGPGGSIVRELGQYGTKGTLRLPVLDPTGRLSSLSPTAALAPFGQRIALYTTLGSGAWSETVPLGVWRITDPGWEGPMWGRMVGSTWIPSPQQLTVSAVDLLAEVADDELPTAMSPLSGGTVVSETARLLDGTLPLGAWSDNRPVAPGAVWEGNRLQALAKIADLVGRVPDIDRGGAYRPTPVKPRAVPDWTIPGDIVVAQAPVPQSDAIVNAWIIDGTDATDKPIRGVAQVNDGPLRFGGPFGRRTRRDQNPLMRSQSAIQAAAETRLANHLGRVALPIQVSCATNPALDLLDTVRVEQVSGTITGQVTRIDLPLGGGVMQITIAVPWREVWR